MRIGIDARAYQWTGLGRYTRHLLENLVALPAAHEYVVFAPRAFARDLAALPRVVAVPVTGSYYSLKEQTTFLMSLLRTRVDLMHFLHFNAPVFYRRPSVVTIHDLTRFFFPAQQSHGPLHQWAYEEVFRASVVHARRIIAVSEHTRNDLLRFFPTVADRTVVIHEGVAHEHFFLHEGGDDARGLLASLCIRKPYLLFVGVWMNHKNISRLLEAFLLIRAQGFRGQLVITGVGRNHDDDVAGWVRRLGLTADVRLPGHVADDVLPCLYRHATAFVFPSLYEGFGLPPLEAMACGVPVVASRVSSLPEILGDAAQYVDPLSSEDIARGVRVVLTDAAARAELIHRGLIHAQRYSWQRCARETLRIYDTALLREAAPVVDSRNTSPRKVHTRV